MDRIRDNKKMVMMTVGAIIAVLVAVFLVLPSGGGGGGDTVDGLSVVYSVASVAEGETITEEMVDVREPEGDEFAMMTFQSVEDVVGSKTIATLEEGQVILDEDIESFESESTLPMGSELSSLVPEGLRAVLMPTGKVQEMVEYLEVGDRIDLIISHKRIGEEGDMLPVQEGVGVQSSTPFKNVEVLMIDRSAAASSDEFDGDEDSSASSASVILAMSPEQAESLLNMRVSGVLETVQITLSSSGVAEEVIDDVEVIDGDN